MRKVLTTPWNYSKSLLVAVCCAIFYAHCISAAADELVIEPYMGINYSAVYKNMVTYRSIDYRAITNPIHHTFGATFGLRFSKSWALELNGMYSLTAKNGELLEAGTSLGINSASSNLALFRITGVFSFLESKSGDSNFVALIGLLSACDIVNFTTPSVGKSIDANLVHNRIGIMPEFGMGYVKHFSDRINLRVELRFSPISLSGTSSFFASALVGVYFNF